MDSIPNESRDRKSTPYDYIIVGSGAAGAPLAARLAQAGKRILLLEAGVDGGAQPPECNCQDAEEERTENRQSDAENTNVQCSDDGIDKDGWPNDATRHQAENRHAIFHCPGYHAAASEPELYDSTPTESCSSWHFGVRHFKDDKTQLADEKCEGDSPSIFYPRNSSIGGCTSHNSMITVYGNEYDWQQIQDLTGDPSWAPEKMRYFFKRLERARYSRFSFSRIYTWLSRVKNFINPRHAAGAGHGMGGWLDVTITDPAIAGKPMFRAITSAVEVAEMGGLGRIVRFLKRAFRGYLFQDLDPNDERTIKNSPEGAALVPVSSGRGMRGGPRDFLLQTRREVGEENLTIVTGAFVNRVIFEKDANGGPPVAVGVDVSLGRDLYEVSRPRKGEANAKEKVHGGEVKNVQVFTRGEVVLCGGAFNSPQTLMLSGIGNAADLADIEVARPRDAKDRPIADVVDLKGVGENLRDRYEISVITEMDEDFESLEGVTFDPDRGYEDPADKDRARKEWEAIVRQDDPIDGEVREFRRGVYATNGASIAVLKKSHPELERPDLFLFGVPAVFRGYYSGWSKELLSPRKGERAECRNLWTWVILKAYSKNKGYVRLRSDDPAKEPLINFNYFAEDGGPEEKEAADQDLAALVEGVRYARRLIAKMKKLGKHSDLKEILPGRDFCDDAEHKSDLEDWIKTRSWGHHACGTCRIGKDPWQASPENLEDKGAVVDSKFRVHGVQNLRVVDASVFPEIPGYFIATPIYMIAEKAADTLVAHECHYPSQLQTAEAAAVRKRREKADSPRKGTGEEQRLPADTVGFAFSGGGIRSATFCLGVLQGLARKNRLREIDFLSTVSGGGYIGCFLGSLFNRMVGDRRDPVKHVQEILKDCGSPPLRWLRSTANYILGAGGVDAWQSYGLVLRNLLTVHLLFFVAGFGLLGVVWCLGDYSLVFLPSPGEIFGEASILGSLSPWWWLPFLVIGIGAIPAALGYWFAPKPGTQGYVSFLPFLALLVGLILVVVIAGLPGGTRPALIMGVILVAAHVWVQLVRPRWDVPTSAIGVGDVMRNRLTLYVGSAVRFGVLAVGWVAVDTLSRLIVSEHRMLVPAMMWTIMMPVLPIAPWLVRRLGRFRNVAFGIVSFPLAFTILVLINCIVHLSYGSEGSWGMTLTIGALLCTWVLGPHIACANSTSLLTGYSARLARTFLGASNSARIYESNDAFTGDVRIAHPDDDIPFSEYHPEDNGGPVHLISVSVNETVDFRSHRDIADEKGMLMTVGPCGLSVGRYHGMWTTFDGGLPLNVRIMNALDGESAMTHSADSVEGIRIPNQEFHVLRKKNNAPVPVEPLSLRSWMGISGAAYTTGLGRQTNLASSLLFGLVNLRLGYWWDTRLEAGHRPGRIGMSIAHRLKRLPLRLMRMQMLMFSELRARFLGPGERYWYLSDGGHIDNSGVYELIRRRLPLIVAVDAGVNGFENTSDVVQQVRRDFEAEIEFLEPNGEESSWSRFAEEQEIPELVKDWFRPAAFGAVDDARRREGPRAALAHVTHEDGERSWLVVMKPSLLGNEPIDVTRYGETNPDFPMQSTLDQFFDAVQWESYRKLGELTADEVLKEG